jgi:N-acetylmuramoyl-L-alanine amidase
LKTPSPIVLFLLLVLIAGTHPAHATDDSVPGDEIEISIQRDRARAHLGSIRGLSKVTPSERLARTQAVLKRFGVAEEESFEEQLRPYAASANREAFNRILPFVDPLKEWVRFMSLTTGVSGGRDRLQGFLDRDGRSVPDFDLIFGENRTEPSWKERLRELKRINPSTRPLEGLRIALDPGHMGGAPWADRTGKFVVASDGRKLDEGILALQTCLLLARELTELGAVVDITRSALRPVSDLVYESFDLAPYAHEELASQQLNPWFLGLVDANPVGDRLNRSFENHASFKKIFGASARSRFFILREDLRARWERMNAFSPDLSLIVHYDVVPPASGNQNGLNPNSPNFTKAYVYGGVDGTEWATRADRAQFARHVLDEQTWWGSVELSRSIVSQIEVGMGIKKQPSHGPNATKVEEGVFARNLGLSRRLSDHPQSYLEILFYNRPAEFEALRKEKTTMKIDGVDYLVSERLLSVVSSLKAGVLQFAQAER